MPKYTKKEVEAKIEALDAKIEKAEKAQSYTSGGPGAGMQHEAGDLKAMYRERKYWIGEWEKLDALEKKSGVNLARFPGAL